MPLLLLLVLTLACWPQRWELPGQWCESPWICVGLTWFVVGLTILAAKGISVWVRWLLARYPNDRNRWIHRYRFAKRYHYYSLYPIFAGLVYILGWGWAVQSILPGGQETRPYLSSGGELFII